MMDKMVPVTHLLHDEPYEVELLPGIAVSISGRLTSFELFTIEAGAEEQLQDVRAALTALGQHGLSGEEAASPAVTAGIRTMLIARAIGQKKITGWRGIADMEGKPLTLTPENIDALMTLPAFASAFFFAMVNGLPPAPETGARQETEETA